MDLKKRLESHPLTFLKKQISNTNIRGYSKLKKAELIQLMLKNKDRFDNIPHRDDMNKSKPIKKPEPKKPKPKKPEPKKKPKTEDEILDEFFDTLDLSPLGQLKTNMESIISGFDAKSIKKQGISSGNKTPNLKQYKDYADRFNNLINKILKGIKELTNAEQKSFFENNKQLKKDFDEVTKNFKKRYNAHRKILVKKSLKKV